MCPPNKVTNPTYRPAILLYRVASSLLTRSKSTSKTADPKQSPRASPPSVVELCQALQIENAHMALLMNLRRDRPEDSIIQRDLPLVLNRAVRIYDEAVLIHGRNQAKDGGHNGDIEIKLCDETYPAILFNAAVYYEVNSPPFKTEFKTHYNIYRRKDTWNKLFAVTPYHTWHYGRMGRGSLHRRL